MSYEEAGKLIVGAYAAYMRSNKAMLDYLAQPQFDERVYINLVKHSNKLYVSYLRALRAMVVKMGLE